MKVMWKEFDKNNIEIPDGTRLLIDHGDEYWIPAMYNETCECFDTDDGDDFLCSLDSVTHYFIVPNKYMCDEIK